MTSVMTGLDHRLQRIDTLIEVQVRLAAAPFDTSSIKVSLEDDVLHLTGIVPDIAAKRDARALLHSVTGVTRVKNDLCATATQDIHLALTSPPATGIQTGSAMPQNVAELWSIIDRLRNKVHYP